MQRTGHGAEKGVEEVFISITILLPRPRLTPLNQLHIDEAGSNDGAQLRTREMEIKALAKPPAVPLGGCLPRLETRVGFDKKVKI
jgi:hypothetical protein